MTPPCWVVDLMNTTLTFRLLDLLAWLAGAFFVGTFAVLRRRG